uniref:NADH-ubiquinone oxidoreductase chain 2 n=1 Tax=Paracercion v-nigrum TaxID=1389458 RepID=A0A650FGZ2_9ODON|nr:NADH dehydrogenase subunit 2 [Paracercion v-nigrum]
MKMNLSYMLFLSSMILGTMITISSKSWLMMWIGLEMNLLSIIPLMNKSKTPFESEASMKYFMVQAMASMLLLMSLIASGLVNLDIKMLNLIYLMSMFIKMGAAPMHMWFPAVMQGLSWMNCVILMTWQKIAPMVMMSYQMMSNDLMYLMIMMSVVVGSIGGLNQTSLRKIMAYSSISHVGWMLLAMMMSKEYWIMYFLIYSILSGTVVILMNSNSLFYLPQIFMLKSNSKMKFSLFTSMLSLGGLPPFLGFLPKWLIIQNSVLFNNKVLIIIMIMTTMITLYFYLRVTYSAYTMSNQSNNWVNSNDKTSIAFMSMSVSLVGIPIITMLSMY